MTECVILFRNTINNRVGFVTEDDAESIAVFVDRDKAIEAAFQVPILQAYPWQLVELDELPRRPASDVGQSREGK